MEELLSDHARRVLLGDRQCTATSKTTGERCKRASALGQYVCDMHGAKAPLSMKAGRERLLMLVEPALDALLRALKTAPPCPACGRSDSDRDPVVVRAAQLVLDRCGYHPTMSVQVEAPPNVFANASTDEVIERLEALLTFAREQQALERRALPAAEDAFIVPDDEPIQNAGVNFPNETQQREDCIAKIDAFANDSEDSDDVT